MSAPSHCYAFIFCAFYLPKSNKCPGHLGHVCVCVCVCLCAPVRACVRAWVQAWTSLLHLCSSTSPSFMSGNVHNYVRFADFISHFLIKCTLLQSYTCVCVCVCVCVRLHTWDRMFVPICICALDPGLYKNVKHFRFILGLLLFVTN